MRPIVPVESMLASLSGKVETRLIYHEKLHNPVSKRNREMIMGKKVELTAAVATSFRLCPETYGSRQGALIVVMRSRRDSHIKRSRRIRRSGYSASRPSSSIARPASTWDIRRRIEKRAAQQKMSRDALKTSKPPRST